MFANWLCCVKIALSLILYLITELDIMNLQNQPSLKPHELHQLEIDQLLKEIRIHGPNLPEHYFLDIAIARLSPALAAAAVGAGARPNRASIVAAIRTGSAPLVFAVLAAGARTDNDLLDLAIETQNPSIVHLVIAAGARPCKASLDLAIRTGSAPIVIYLLALKLQPDIHSFRLAIEGGNGNIISTVTEACEGVNRAFLEIAVRSGSHSAVVAVLTKGVRPDDAVLGLAQQEKNREIVRLLERKVKKREYTEGRFFSESTGMPVSREDLTDEGMAEFYRRIHPRK